MRQRDKHADRQTGSQADRQTGRRADGQTGRRADRQRGIKFLFGMQDGRISFCPGSANCPRSVDCSLLYATFCVDCLIEGLQSYVGERQG